MADGPELITVGQLARRVGLTAKALRHYDRVGLLAPAVVDPGAAPLLVRRGPGSRWATVRSAPKCPGTRIVPSAVPPSHR
ncbi:MerR family DNA-binding transcriptional regulator [Kitasatospora sp. NBC_01266]|uniref:MerR family DNA-binding transcriptional regulator n=1 Tax=Kitasatospora sp. NBC_01266 TaxID=2903572 RepID=UPI002E345ED9|nr:MerR family DNA-binding transcriptional regulator [Kitasatospora sp. NBC_01266]